MQPVTTVNRGRAGFSMIELMVVILIIGLLAVASAPFTRSWVNGVRQREAANVLNQAVGQAKAFALRNPNSLEGFVNGVVQLKLANDGTGTVTVTSLTSLGAELATEWTGQLHPSVVVKAYESPLNYVTYNNLGVKIYCRSSAGVCTTTAPTLAVTAGSQPDAEAISVDLL